MIGRIEKSTQLDIFQIPLMHIIDEAQPVFLLAGRINWDKIISELSVYYSPDKGRHSIPVRKLSGMAILKYLYKLSDKVVLERWLEDAAFQYFCGEVFLQHKRPFGRSELVKFRHRIGESGMSVIFSPENLLLMEEFGPKDEQQESEKNISWSLFRLFQQILTGKAGHT